MAEKSLCCVIMLCQMTAILSGVSMLYLAVIIIIPSKNELKMGISTTPIMCSTVNMENINLQTKPDGTPATCEWASCREWCLSKIPAMCYQIRVRPRLRGANITLEDCDEEEQDDICSALNVPNSVPYRCKKGECKDLTGLFHCNITGFNECRDIAPSYDCKSANMSREPIQCNENKCFLRLHGVVGCTNGGCLLLNDIKHYDQCERKCSKLDMVNYNTVIFSQERLISKKCKTVSTSNGTMEFKELSTNSKWLDMKEVLMVFCTYVTPTETGFELDDCFNGTLGDYNKVKALKDYVDLIEYHYEVSKTREWLLAPEEDLQLTNDTRLYINSEQCVNTLKKECTRFYRDHIHDERDGRTRDRFPCYRTPLHNDFVTAQYNPEETSLYLLLGSVVPASVFIFSCGCLFFCSKVVQTDDQGHMVIRSFKKEPMQEHSMEL